MRQKHPLAVTGIVRTQGIAGNWFWWNGAPANFLRGFRALCSSLISNSVVMGWVIAAMVKIVKTAFGWEPKTALAVLIFVAFFYTILSGLWGVVLTDLVQFILAMTRAIWLAIAALGAIVETLPSRLGQVPTPKNFLVLPFFCGGGLRWLGFIA